MVRVSVVLFVFGQVFFDDEVVDDEVLAFGSVLAHIVFEEFLHLVFLSQRDLFEAYVGAYESGELVGRDFSETFEAGDLRVGREVADSLQPLFFAVAVACDEVFLRQPSRRRGSLSWPVCCAL